MGPPVGDEIWAQPHRSKSKKPNTKSGNVRNFMLPIDAMIFQSLKSRALVRQHPRGKKHRNPMHQYPILPPHDPPLELGLPTPHSWLRCTPHGLGIRGHSQQSAARMSPMPQHKRLFLCAIVCTQRVPEMGPAPIHRGQNQPNKIRPSANP